MELLLGRKRAAAFLGLRPPQKILDVACGTGSLAYELAKLGYSVIGIDESKESLDQAEQENSKTLDLHFQQTNAIHLPFKNAEFDVASISFALHGMPYETEIKVLHEMKRVTKAGGRLLIVDYNEPRKHWVAKLTYPLIKLTESSELVHFIERGLDQLLRDVGLEVEKETNMGGLLQIVVVTNP